MLLVLSVVLEDETEFPSGSWAKKAI